MRLGGFDKGDKGTCKVRWLLILSLLFLPSCLPPPEKVTAWGLCPQMIMTLDLIEKKEANLRFPGEVMAVASLFKPDPAYWEP